MPKSVRCQMTSKPNTMNNRPALLVPLFLAVRLVTPLAMGVAPTPDELSEAHHWAAAKFQGRQETPKPQPGLSKGQPAPYAPGVPFAFIYDGRPSADLLTEWPLERSSRDRGQSQTERILTWADPKTGLQVRCVAIEYDDFPTVEWTLYFKNTGTNATPIL